MINSILYIHDSCPNPDRSGSDAVIFRHLKLAEINGWKINIILPDSSAPLQNLSAFPTTWSILLIKNSFIKYWMINRLRVLVYTYYILRCWRFVYKSKPTVVVSYLWGFNFVGLARWVSILFNIRLIYFYHDRYEFFFPENNRDKLKKFETRNAHAASKILTVSNQLIFDSFTKSRHVVLLPMPNGEDLHKQSLNRTEWVYAGTLYKYQYDFMTTLAKSLQKIGKTLTIITNLDEALFSHFRYEENVVLKPRFATQEKLFKYLSTNAFVNFTVYPSEVNLMPWVKDCFPSKFIEYCFFDIPFVGFSVPSTAFYEWCIENDYRNIYNAFSASDLDAVVIKFDDPDFIQLSKKNQEEIKNKHFLPQLIQNEFEKQL